MRGEHPYVVIENLRARVAELEAEVERLRSDLTDAADKMETIHDLSRGWSS